MLRQLRDVEEVDDRRPIDAAPGDRHDVAVPDLHGHAGHVAGVLRLAAPDGAHVGVEGGRVPQAGGHRLLNRDIHMLPLAGHPLVEESNARRHRSVGAGLELGLVQRML